MKCDRSHKRNMRIAADLAAHAELMNRLKALGMSRTTASKLAYDVVTHRISEADALAKVDE
jgi:predicted transcriptional regulator